MSQTEAAAPAEPLIPPDPLVHKSYSVPIAIAMLAVVGATVLAVVDEMWLRRPYKAVQAQYAETYSAYLARVEAKRREFYVNVLTRIAEYEALKTAVSAQQAACSDEAAKIQSELDTATDQSRRLVEAVKESKSEITALTYEAEHKAHAAGHAKVDDCDDARPILDEVARINRRVIEYFWPARTFSGEYETGDTGARAAKFDREEKSETGNVADLLVKCLDLEAKKAELQQRLGAATRPLTAAVKKRDEWLADNLGNLAYVLETCDDATRKAIAASGAARYLDERVVTLKPDTLASIRKGVVEKYANGAGAVFGGEINQIHIKEATNWVDRCETCHLNARASMPVTVESLRTVLGTAVGDLPAWDGSKIDSMPLALFASHPNPALLRTHAPDRFGCSMCHNGNGVAITNTALAHGENRHWLQPLFPKVNAEAGCVQCHQKDLVIPMGERITAGKDAFRRAGCWGCHKYEGFNREVDEITALTGRSKAIGDEMKAKDLRKENLRLLLGAIADDEEACAREAPAVQRERDEIAEETSALATERAEVKRRLGDVHAERLRVGPNLKDVKIKLRREFVTDWIRNPREAHKDAAGNAYRADTKMPVFRWWGDPDEEVRDVAAFIWQSALDPSEFPEYRLPAFTPGDAKNGEKLFVETGCLSCHSIGTGTSKIGNDYAANLSNLGEKNRPEYVARWINHPRRRLVALNPDLDAPADKRDVSGADPNDRSLVWTQPAIMPNFRLDETDVRDITTYLMSQKRADVRYEEPTWLDDKDRFKRGRKLALFQGCAGCHEIRRLEDEKGIGTGLTAEGSKPLEQLDFGHLTIPAERGVEPLKGAALLEDAARLFEKDEHWYRPRGFFLHKLAKPDVYDESKHLPDRFNRLRMPQFKFSAQEILDVTSLLLGSVETKIPETFRHRPDAAGQAIRDGWWVVKKYNCQGCHQIEPADEPPLWKVPFFAEKLDKRDGFLPPSLVGVGFRLRPEWLAKFLRDPSLGGDRARPKSVRPHLAVRMPTFDFSDDEIQKLVLFFQAMAGQPAIYQPPAMKRLTDAEKKAAAAIWKSANCIQCHVVDGMPTTSETKAPNLSHAPARLRPEWAHRWVSNPPLMNPRTAMLKVFGDAPGPDGKWRFMTALPELAGITADHVDLVVRYVGEGHVGK